MHYLKQLTYIIELKVHCIQNYAPVRLVYYPSLKQTDLNTIYAANSLAKAPS